MEDTCRCLLDSRCGGICTISDLRDIACDKVRASIYFLELWRTLFWVEKNILGNIMRGMDTTEYAETGNADEESVLIG